MEASANWIEVKIRCQGCRNKVTGYKNDSGDIKYKCNKCNSSVYSSKKYETIGNKKYKTYKINIQQEIK